MPTRDGPRRTGRPAGRVDAGLLAATTWTPADEPRVYVCGPTPFVEVVANLLVDAGHDPASIRTLVGLRRRFGPQLPGDPYAEALVPGSGLFR